MVHPEWGVLDDVDGVIDKGHRLLRVACLGDLGGTTDEGVTEALLVAAVVGVDPLAGRDDHRQLDGTKRLCVAHRLVGVGPCLLGHRQGGDGVPCGPLVGHTLEESRGLAGCHGEDVTGLEGLLVGPGELLDDLGVGVCGDPLDVLGLALGPPEVDPHVVGLELLGALLAEELGDGLGLHRLGRLDAAPGEGLVLGAPVEEALEGDHRHDLGGQPEALQEHRPYPGVGLHDGLEAVRERQDGALDHPGTPVALALHPLVHRPADVAVVPLAAPLVGLEVKLTLADLSHPWFRSRPSLAAFGTTRVTLMSRIRLCL